ncbi:MAG: hypothetical protein Q7K57_36490 [Burkholderiaceae bacterium]|nr:hypothetical protein [Burkholderiaceae bacterium]
MMLFVELQYFDRETLTKIRWQMLVNSADGTRWVEWTPELSRLCEQPDLTLIGPQHLSWIEVAKLANSANGRQVVLVGDSEFTLGLSTLPLDFAMHELLAFLPWSTQDGARQTEEAGTRRPKPEYKRTMPLGIHH